MNQAAGRARNRDEAFGWLRLEEAGRRGKLQQAGPGWKRGPNPRSWSRPQPLARALPGESSLGTAALGRAGGQRFGARAPGQLRLSAQGPRGRPLAPRPPVSTPALHGASTRGGARAACASTSAHVRGRGRRRALLRVPWKGVSSPQWGAVQCARVAVSPSRLPGFMGSTSSPPLWSPRAFFLGRDPAALSSPTPQGLPSRKSWGSWVSPSCLVHLLGPNAGHRTHCQQPPRDQPPLSGAAVLTAGQGSGLRALPSRGSFGFVFFLEVLER